MNLKNAIDAIVIEKKVKHADFIKIDQDKIDVDISFESEETMKEFCFAWASEIRLKTDTSFYFSCSCFCGDGVKQTVSYKPHKASRGSDVFAKGNSRSNSSDRRSWVQGNNLHGFLNKKPPFEND